MTTQDPERARANGQPQVFPNSSSQDDSPVESNLESISTRHTQKEDVSTESVDGEPSQFDDEDTPVEQIQRDLDELTYSGAAINDLEVQLMRHREFYRRTLGEGRVRVDQLSKKLNSHIMKSEPFVNMWRKAKEVQESSNRAAARYDKANSQHAAAKEMIRVAEAQLEARLLEAPSMEPPSSPSPLDSAWQEMLNHATDKVVLTEKERRDSELEHQRVLEECTQVMAEYRATEKRLRSHITKSRPYYEARYKTNQHLLRLKGAIKDLEEKIGETKLKYSASLKRLDLLSTEMHMRRGTLDGTHLGRHGLDPRKVLSTGNSPILRHNGKRSGREDVVSVDSLQLSELGGGYGGSTSSLPSVNNDSNTEHYEALQKFSSSSHSSSPTSPPESLTSLVPPTSLSPSTVSPLPASPAPTPQPLPPSVPLATVSSTPTSLSTSLATPPSVTMPTTSALATPPSVTMPTASALATPLSVTMSTISALATPPSVTVPTTFALATPTSVTMPTVSALATSPLVATPSFPSVTTPEVTPCPSACTSLDSSPSSSTPMPSPSSLFSSRNPEVTVQHRCEDIQSLHEMARQLVEGTIDTALSQIHPTTGHQ